MVKTHFKPGRHVVQVDCGMLFNAATVFKRDVVDTVLVRMDGLEKVVVVVQALKDFKGNAHPSFGRNRM